MPKALRSTGVLYRDLAKSSRWPPMASIGKLVTVIGPAGTPAVAAAATFVIFEFIEKISSANVRNALQKELKEFDAMRVASLLSGTIELFQRIFGAQHISRKCVSVGGDWSLRWRSVNELSQRGRPPQPLLRWPNDRLPNRSFGTGAGAHGAARRDLFQAQTPIVACSGDSR
jgi:hypothetical protein